MNEDRERPPSPQCLWPNPTGWARAPSLPWDRGRLARLPKKRAGRPRSQGREGLAEPDRRPTPQRSIGSPVDIPLRLIQAPSRERGRLARPCVKEDAGETPALPGGIARI